jgi:DNA-directed RNA polymerase specialized sigma24 family protein
MALMRAGAQDARSFVERVRPLFDELFQTAYALTGNLELAEYVLRSTLLEAYLRRSEWRERMSFRDGLSYTLGAVALTELKRIRSVGGFETDWTLPDADNLSAQERALRTRLEKETPRMLRMLLLVYGCGQRPAHIAQALSMSSAGVREGLRRLTSRLERSFHTGRRGMEAQLEALCEKLIGAPCADAPACGAMLRTFERDAQGLTARRVSAGRAAGMGFLAIGALLCALLFWLLTVLLEPRSVAPDPLDASAPAQNMSISSNNSD